MPAGFVIAQLNVTNPENYKEYVDKVKSKRILKKIPNRIKFLDELNLNTYPLVCK